MEQQEQPQQDFIPGGYYPNNDGKADLLDKIRPEEVIEEMKQRFMGREWDVVKEKWVPNPALREMSLTETGASELTNLIFTASTRNVAISNLKDEEIKKRLLSIIRTAMKMCLDNWRRYGITTVSQFYAIKEALYTNTLVALKQSENEGIRRLLNSVISENRNVSTFGEEKKGILGLFRRRS
jgi:hypothetical protein